MTQRAERTDASREAGKWAQRTSLPPTTGSAKPPPCQTQDFKKWLKQNTHAFSPKQTMASIVKCCGTLTVRGGIKTQFENSGPFPLLSFSPLKATDNFLLQLGHRRGPRNTAAQFQESLRSEKYVFVFLSLTDLPRLNGPGCNGIRAPTGGLVYERKARCTADTLHIHWEGKHKSGEPFFLSLLWSKIYGIS